MPEGDYRIPIGKAEIVRPGSDVTVIALRHARAVALAASKTMGIDAEVIDLRSIMPLDTATIVESVNKTGRCVIAHEATCFAGLGAELTATIREQVLLALWRADPARHRMGHALSAGLRVGILPRAGTAHQCIEGRARPAAGLRGGARQLARSVRPDQPR